MIKKNEDFYAKEYLKCRQNPLYFIYNYVKIPEIGGSTTLNRDNLHLKMKQTVRVLYRYNKAILMASRQLGKALSINTLIPIFGDNNFIEFKELKDIKVGDFLFDEYYNKTLVVAKTNVMYNRSCYKINFFNDESIIADKNHIWKINNKLISTKLLYLKFKFFKFLKLNKRFNIFKNEKYFTHVTSIYKVDSAPVQCIQVFNANNSGMFLCGKKQIPTHNSTIAAAYITWALNFFPGIPAIILNMRQVAALENLSKIKFIHSNLPGWMKSPLKGRAERKTYLELENNSIVRTFYPASTTGPDQIARSLTAPILYIDEVAFIRHIGLAYRAAQPVLTN